MRRSPSSLRRRAAVAVWIVPAMAVGLFTRAAPADSSAAPKLPKVRVAEDGGGFVTEAGEAYAPIGVNYFRPHTGWAPQLWRQFDVGATKADFATMRDLGVNCVRVFLSYGSFYSERGVLDEAGLARFDQFLDMAAAHGIYVIPTGPDHWEGLPEWARTDQVADERHIEALEEFWRLFAARYRGRSVLLAYDLRNEPSVGWDSRAMRTQWPAWLEAEYGSLAAAGEALGIEDFAERFEEVGVPDPERSPPAELLLAYQRFRESLAERWTARQAAAIREADPEALVTVGMIQWSVPTLLPRVQHYSGFRPERQAEHLDYLTVHFYPLDGGLAYRNPEEVERNLAYVEGIVREVARAGKPVVLGEFGWYGGGAPRFGGGQPTATEEQQAEYCRRVVETTAPWVCGWLNWGLFDTPEARDVSELTGLLTVDGEEKAWGHTFRTLAERYRGWRPPPADAAERPDLDWDAAVVDPAAGHAFRETYRRSFRAVP